MADDRGRCDVYGCIEDPEVPCESSKFARDFDYCEEHAEEMLERYDDLSVIDDDE